jgi:predicted ATPase
MRVVNFGCVKDVTVDLTPLHAFVGPNDSGKSTLLKALRSVVAADRGPFLSPSVVSVKVGDSAWTQQSYQAGVARTIEHSAHVEPSEALSRDGGDFGLPKGSAVSAAVRRALAGARMLRLEPDAMRKPSRLIPKSHPIEFAENGDGLSGVYDALLSRQRKSFDMIVGQFRGLFPTVEELELAAVSEGTKLLGVRLIDGTDVPADTMSEGMLYWLAFAALPHLSDTAICLIEEPENGLHPARVAEVVRVLRDASQHTQILLATHSPLVVNELQPDEVTIITRTPERGTIATPMTQTRNFAKRSKAYALGELWLSYADGDLEEKLVGDGSGDAPVAAVGEP